MKFVQIAILGMVGESAALPMYATPSNCIDTTAGGNTCNSKTAYGAADGIKGECAHLMRGQATGMALYGNNDNFGVWTTAVK